MLATKHKKLAKISAGVATFALLLTACSGDTTESETNSSDNTGYEYGASVEEIQAAFEDIDPITITFQPASLSPTEPGSERAHAFIENIETKSNGKVTVDTTYAQGIAGFREMPDALADGRIDVGYMLPVYLPDEFPIFQGYVTATALTGTSPVLDELAANAAFGELAWADENLINEYRDIGIEPLHPFNAAGAIFPMCTDEHTSFDDWDGTQIRASGVTQTRQLAPLGATPVSLEYTEAYEALQRNVIDCTASAALPGATGGAVEVAPHVAYASGVTLARGPGSFVAGRAWDTWPLAVQQLVFDTTVQHFNEHRRADLIGIQLIAEAVRDQNGTFKEMDDDIQKTLVEVSETLVDDAVADGILPEGHTQTVKDTVTKWRDIAEELGYEEEGSIEDFDQWFDAEVEDIFDPFGERYFEEVMLPHRPN